MKYIGTDFLYNLEEIYYPYQIFCDNGTELYILFDSKNKERTSVAVSRALLYKRFGVCHKETEYDVFEIDFPIVYTINGENIAIENESNVINRLSSFAHSSHRLLSSWGCNILVGNADIRSEILKLTNADKYSSFIEPTEEDIINLKFTLQLLFEEKYVIRVNEKDIFCFKNLNYAKKVFTLISSSIKRMISSLCIRL